MERKYQIFISSTYVDLIKEREVVTKQILEDHHFPIGMEMFAPNDKKQWETIKATIDSSDIYLLLVGFRYGSIDPDDKISYTEKEFNYALSKGMPVIAFVKNDDIEIEHKRLKELPENERFDLVAGKDKLQTFYSTYYDVDQTNIRKFRSRAKTDRITGFFNEQKPIDVKSAISNKIKELPSGGWIKQKYFLRSEFFIGLILLLLLVFGFFVYRENSTIRNRLKATEEQLFAFSKDSTLEFARVLPDYESIMKETNIGETFSTTKSDFYFMSNAGKVFHEYTETIDSCIRHGVVFKILLIDTASVQPGKLNHHLVFDPDSKLYKTKLEKMRADFKSTIDFMTKIDSIPKQIKNAGHIEIRLYSGPAPYQMWIKDPKNSNGLVHFNTVAYTGFKPHFRVTPTSSPKLFKLFVDDFEKKWNDTLFIRCVLN